MLRILAVTLWFVLAAPGQSQELALEAEVMEGSSAIELPGIAPKQLRYAVVHHKQQKHQARIAAWLRNHGGGRISFQTRDGVVHQAVLQRLKHCFGRGLLLYTDPVPLEAKDVIRLQLGAAG